MTDSNRISAEVLNSAIEALGLGDLRFESVEGKPVLRRAYDDISLEHFIGLVLTAVGAAHLQRLRAIDVLAEIEAHVARLGGEQTDAEGRETAISALVLLLADVREILTSPALDSDRTPTLEPRLTVGPIVPGDDLA